MKTYKIEALKFTNRADVTVSQHDGARMPCANPAFLPNNMTEYQRNKAIKEAVETVPFHIEADVTDHKINEFGRPYLPATSFRGSLSGISTNLLLNVLKSPISPASLTILSNGGKLAVKKKKGEKEEKEPTLSVSERFLNQNHGLPHLSIFGLSSPHFLKGFQTFSNLISEGHFVLQKVGQPRQPIHIQNAGALRALSPAGLEEYAAGLELENGQASERKAAETEAKEAKKAFEEAKIGGNQVDIEAAKTALSEAYARRDAVKDSTEVATSQLHAKWVIPMGVNFKFISHVNLETEEELATLVTVLSEFVQLPWLGGERGRGSGALFDVSLRVSERTGYEEWEEVCIIGGENEHNVIPFRTIFAGNLEKYHNIIINDIK